MERLLIVVADIVSSFSWWQICLILVAIGVAFSVPHATKYYLSTERKEARREHLAKLLQQYCPHAEEIEGSDPPEFRHRADVSITHPPHGKYADRKWICYAFVCVT